MQITENCRITLSKEEWAWVSRQRQPVDPMGVTGPPPIEAAIEGLIRDAMRRDPNLLDAAESEQ
ncbi:MAG: hypothetical protein HOL85_09595 [Rhodospirillaceae bacterium]|jgi:hypothetical protein|nr:hypothetical protein [Rhodospirillaceae bacterium]MBT6137273.1 hypothetical protein [Rhodospirillaceae bacterium]